MTQRYGVRISGALYPDLRTAVAMEWPGADTRRGYLAHVRREMLARGGSAVLVFDGKWRHATLVPITREVQAALAGQSVWR